MNLVIQLHLLCQNESKYYGKSGSICQDAPFVLLKGYLFHAFCILVSNGIVMVNYLYNVMVLLVLSVFQLIPEARRIEASTSSRFSLSCSPEIIFSKD